MSDTPELIPVTDPKTLAAIQSACRRGDCEIIASDWIDDDDDEPDEVPIWEQARVSVATPNGMIECPALVHPWCPGLAVTAFNIGDHVVTHTATGKKMSIGYERMATAMQLTAELSAIARDCGFSYENMSGLEIGKALTDNEARPVPFGGCTEGDSVMSLGTWVRMWRSEIKGEEFPWEEESPWDITHRITKTLNPRSEEQMRSSGARQVINDRGE